MLKFEYHDNDALTIGLTCDVCGAPLGRLQIPEISGFFSRAGGLIGSLAGFGLGSILNQIEQAQREMSTKERVKHIGVECLNCSIEVALVNPPAEPD